MKADEVPPGPLVVDTDVVSFVAWRKGRYADFEPFLVNRVVAISFATAGELYMGAERARWGDERRAQLDLVIRRYYVLTPNDAVIRMFGRVYSRTRGRLGETGVNDAWTAACALAQSPVPGIVTNNRTHFETIAKEFPELLVVHPDSEEQQSRGPE